MTTREPTPSILISYDGEPVALVNARLVTFIGSSTDLPDGSPLLRMLLYMARYAQLVATGERLGPYTDEDAERFARAALIDPVQLRAHRDETNNQLAARFKLPVEQIPAARCELISATRPSSRPHG